MIEEVTSVLFPNLDYTLWEINIGNLVELNFHKRPVTGETLKACVHCKYKEIIICPLGFILAYSERLDRKKREGVLVYSRLCIFLTKSCFS